MEAVSAELLSCIFEVRGTWVQQPPMSDMSQLLFLMLVGEFVGID
jgi:hypothetical protein